MIIILHFDQQPQFKYMNYFIYTSHHFTPQGRYKLNKLALLPMGGFIAQLVEHCTGIAEVTGSNPVEALIFFRLLLSNCLNWKIYCDDHSSLWHGFYCHDSISNVRNITNKFHHLSASSAGVAQLAQSVEHQTFNLRVMGSSPTLWAIFSFFWIIVYFSCAFSVKLIGTYSDVSDVTNLPLKKKTF